MDGSIEAFADQMNEEARKLGAVDSHFVNPHGLHSENHYTTAYDLYLIFNEAFKYPVFREIIESKSYTANYTSAAGDSVSKKPGSAATSLSQAREIRHKELLSSAEKQVLQKQQATA